MAEPGIQARYSGSSIHTFLSYNILLLSITAFICAGSYCAMDFRVSYNWSQVIYVVLTFSIVLYHVFINHLSYACVYMYFLILRTVSNTDSNLSGSPNSDFFSWLWLLVISGDPRPLETVAHATLPFILFVIIFTV